MRLGHDFWLIIRIIQAAIKVISEVFGDEEDESEKKKIVG